MKIFIKKKWKYSLLLIPIIIIIIVVYTSDYYRAMPEAKIMLRSNDKVEYTGSPWIEYTAKNKIVTKGLIIYPGGKVAPEAYAPLAEKVAESGFKVVIVPMPMNLAVLSPNKAEKVIGKYPQIKQWYIAGHSLGGVMASQFAYKNQDKINGLILLASYPQKSNNLSSSVVKVLSMYGTKDGFVGKDKIDESRKLLPKSTKLIPIKGGNHSQNGWYGFQKGDNAATITRDEQQNIIDKAIVEFIGEN
ncbi:alpha/beta fold hydrolase [Clostridium estertheticum]|uniref:alpha/beta fold hydrolase n=1 Tax=Clostridium estertheticum TaxID=238834 RepID=UPI001C0DDEDB|nr:alpha/beta fold hydrolase [Clostridium estertheticum]MBU3075194.1 alpha/beta hydrolase [Clostridium estertheticum]MBU3165409.1 alpha/beta hydrolase [Clostridium estertheticum]MBU3170416.1 alpha/beta hydrolase [Clostridium estertheticum]